MPDLHYPIQGHEPVLLAVAYRDGEEVQSKLVFPGGVFSFDMCDGIRLGQSVLVEAVDCPRYVDQVEDWADGRTECDCPTCNSIHIEIGRYGQEPTP